MSNHKLLEHEDRIVTKMGKAFLSERVVFRGKDLHLDLKDMDWLELFVYGITGKRFSAKQMKMLNFMWISTSYPDKSIWPNHIAALCASSRSTPILGISAGLSVFEAKLYAGTPVKVCIDFLIRAKQELENNGSLEDFLDQEIAKHKTIYGYGRPLTSIDERIPHVINFAKEQDLGDGEYLEIAFKIGDLLKARKNLEMNIVAIYAAIGADLGFSPQEFHMFMTPAAFAGMPPCFIEANENPEGSFLPIRCNRVTYTGKPKRDW